MLGFNGRDTRISKRRQLCDAKTQITIPGVQLPSPEFLLEASPCVGGVPVCTPFPAALLCAVDMTSPLLPCDGCGQPASPEHIARRLQRLEWTTRYRPVHIATLLLAPISPRNDAEFLYSGKFAGEAALLLEVVGIRAAGKTAETVLAELQRAGYFLAYVLECPLDADAASDSAAESLLRGRVRAVGARIRRSLRPKRTVLIGEALAPLSDSFSVADMGGPVILDGGKPFAIEGAGQAECVARLRRTLGGGAAAV